MAKPSFEVDTRIEVRIDYILAGELSQLILTSKTRNPALLSLAHQLEDEEETVHRRLERIKSNGK